MHSRFQTIKLSGTSLTIAAVLAVLVLASSTNSASAANGSAAYTYDALGRITSISYDTGVLILYSYDANGNRTQQTINVNTATLCWNTTTACSPTNKTANWGVGLWQ